MSTVSSGVRLPRSARVQAIGLSAAIALTASACFRPVYERPACGPDDACPEGLTCVGHMFCGNCDPNALGDPRCGPSGTCEPNASCSLSDATCPSGRRYSGAGVLSGRCVSDQPPDGGVDSRSDAGPFCYGGTPYTICFATKPTGI